MVFIDRVSISVRGGSGGAGCVSFRREKYVPRGGPDGGDGGRGGDVVVRIDPQMRTLLDIRRWKTYRASDGKPGQGKRKTGRSGDSIIIAVPPGTVVEDTGSGEMIADLTSPGAEVVVAAGGKGGRGNYSFRSATDQAPRRSTQGAPGEERDLELTLKLIADVGLVGLPNAGKSTLLGAVSAAHPVVAPYPFSTLKPVLGIVSIDEAASFCMVDIPGLIEGAHAGKGLGIRFLQHIERCRVLLFVIDGAGDVPPEDAYRQLMAEIGAYSGELLDRPRFIAFNKIDLLSDDLQEPVFSQGMQAGEREPVYWISALANRGLDELMKALYDAVRDKSGDQD
jgi:GTP-binding protein